MDSKNETNEPPSSPMLPLSDDDDVSRYLDFSESGILPLTPPQSETQASEPCYYNNMEMPTPASNNEKGGLTLSNAIQDLSVMEGGMSLIEEASVRENDILCSHGEKELGFQNDLVTENGERLGIGFGEQPMMIPTPGLVIGNEPNGIQFQGEASSSSIQESNQILDPISALFETLDPPPTPLPLCMLDCSGCQDILGEMVLQNGYLATKMSIHGNLGNFMHAIFYLHYFIEGSQPCVDQYFIDFSQRNTHWVRKFLTQFNLLSAHEGSVVLYDSLSNFNNFLCAGMQNQTVDLNSIILIPPLPPPVTEPTSEPQQDEAAPPQLPAPALRKGKEVVVSSSNPNNDDQAGPSGSGPDEPDTRPWPSLAEQRERTKNLQLSEISSLFHLRIVDAARVLRICSTALKHACRRMGLGRWPFRKVQSVARMIENLEKELENKCGEDARRIHIQMEKLNTALELIRAGHDLDLDDLAVNPSVEEDDE